MSSEHSLKQQAEEIHSRAGNRVAQALGTQRLDQDDTFETVVGRGILYTQIVRNTKDERWELLGAGRDTLLSSFKKDPVVTERMFSEQFESKIRGQIEQIEKWFNSRTYDRLQDPNNYKGYLAHLRHLVLLYQNGDQISVALPIGGKVNDNKEAVYFSVVKPEGAHQSFL